MTQAELGRRLGMSQAAVARLERPGANPTVATLDRLMHATGHRLEMTAAENGASVDESLIAANIRLFARRAAHALHLLAPERRPAGARGSGGG